MFPNPIEEEHLLVSRAQAGDRDAFCKLTKQRVAGLLRAAMVFGCERSAAEDVVQETLLVAWRSLERFDGRCRFGTWMFGILRNCLFKSLRRKRPVLLEAEFVRNLYASDEISPDTQIELEEEFESLRHAIDLLPEGQREVLELRFFAQLSLEEIACELNCPVGTVKSRLHHGLEKLRKLKFD